MICWERKALCKSVHRELYLVPAAAGRKLKGQVRRGEAREGSKEFRFYLQLGESL